MDITSNDGGTWQQWNGVGIIKILITIIIIILVINKDIMNMM